MSERKQNIRTQQHPPLRKPDRWTGQEASLLMQIERLFSDIYVQLSLLTEKVRDLEARVEEE